MIEPPQLNRWDLLTGASVLVLLGFAYLVYPKPAVQYAVWLTVFAIWMVWFVFFGVRWLYPESEAGPEDASG